MSPLKYLDLILVAVFVILLECSAVKVDLAQLLSGKNRNSVQSQKRLVDGNPCETPEKPFPCKMSPTCIPMRYACDDNYDCEDGSDEDRDMCTALDRPPVEDIEAFLMSQKHWIIPKLFGNKNILKVAHGLAVSQTADDFRRRLGLSTTDIKNLRHALNDVKNGNEEGMEAYGMPSSAWNEVNFFFSRLIKAGFA